MRNREASIKVGELERADTESVAEILAAERKKHGIKDPHAVEHTARFVIAVMRGLFTMRLIETTAVDEALVAAVLDFLEPALTPDPWPRSLRPPNPVSTPLPTA